MTVKFKHFHTYPTHVFMWVNISLYILHIHFYIHAHIYSIWCGISTVKHAAEMQSACYDVTEGTDTSPGE